MNIFKNLVNFGVKKNSVFLLCTVFLRHRVISNKIFLNFPDVTQSLVMKKFYCHKKNSDHFRGSDVNIEQIKAIYSQYILLKKGFAYSYFRSCNPRSPIK